MSDRRTAVGDERRSRRWRPSAGTGKTARATHGSATLLVLMIAMCLAVLCAGLGSVLIVAQSALHDEDEGREALRRADVAVLQLCVAAASDWQPGDVTLPEGAGGLLSLPSTTTTLLPGGPVAGAIPGYLQATVWVPTSVGQRVTSMDVESGRDGLDLPRAVVVAGRISLAPGRASPVVVPTDSNPAPVALVGTAPADALPVDWPVSHLVAPWRLDEGTLNRLDGSTPEALVSQATVLRGTRGATVRWSGQAPSGAADSPTLIVVTGGADLDLTDFGELWGVIVVDDGSVQFDGSTIHGAVFTSGTLDSGATGTVIWERAVYEWVRYRSTVRARPVPGSRGEQLIVTPTTRSTAAP